MCRLANGLALELCQVILVVLTPGPRTSNIPDCSLLAYPIVAESNDCEELCLLKVIPEIVSQGYHQRRGRHGSVCSRSISSPK
mmetsp:Transcript_36992/g.76909  ORF Transcript_36992/g.76909 Transcript_36992/m.76909 type:complete len:83 (-) Transcript_36992:1223-1471(-)